MNIKRNNQGFTLLEVLVSVAILAIIIVPFGLAFITTSNINAKTKESQRAKFAATNVVEDIRSMEINTLIDKSAMQYDSDNKSTGVYLFTQNQQVDGKDYYVEVTLDPSYDSDSSSDETTDYNAKEYAQLYNMNSAYDAFVDFDRSTDESKVDQIAEALLSNNQATKQAVVKNLTRIITVRITSNYDKTSKKNQTKVYAKASYNYVALGKSHVVETAEQCIYSSSDEEVGLRGIYVFYSPLYKLVDASDTGYSGSKIARETMDIVNEGNVPCTVYLCEQYDAKDPIDTKRQNSYKMRIRLNEVGRSKESLSSGDVITHIRTNVDSKDELKRYQGKTSDSLPEGKLDLQYGNSYNSATGVGAYSSSIKLGQKIIYPADIMGLRDLAGNRQYDVVYGVTAKVYKGTKTNHNDREVFTLKTTTQ